MRQSQSMQNVKRSIRPNVVSSIGTRKLMVDVNIAKTIETLKDEIEIYSDKYSERVQTLERRLKHIKSKILLQKEEIVRLTLAKREAIDKKQTVIKNEKQENDKISRERIKAQDHKKFRQRSQSQLQNHVKSSHNRVVEEQIYRLMRLKRQHDDQQTYLFCQSVFEEILEQCEVQYGKLAQSQQIKRQINSILVKGDDCSMIQTEQQGHSFRKAEITRIQSKISQIVLEIKDLDSEMTTFRKNTVKIIEEMGGHYDNDFHALKGFTIYTTQIRRELAEQIALQKKKQMILNDLTSQILK